MTAVLVAAVVVLVVAVLVLLWRQRPRPYIEYREQIVPVPDEVEDPLARIGRTVGEVFPTLALPRECDLCGEGWATVHLVETFDDDEERDLAGGSTAMRADYCQACADELGVGR